MSSLWNNRLRFVSPQAMLYHPEAIPYFPEATLSPCGCAYLKAKTLPKRSSLVKVRPRSISLPVTMSMTSP